MKYINIIFFVFTDIFLLVNSGKNDDKYLPHLPVVSNIYSIHFGVTKHNLLLIQFYLNSYYIGIIITEVL